VKQPSNETQCTRTVKKSADRRALKEKHYKTHICGESVTQADITINRMV